MQIPLPGCKGWEPAVEGLEAAADPLSLPQARWQGSFWGLDLPGIAQFLETEI